jgi:hypothetical protein
VCCILWLLIASTLEQTLMVIMLQLCCVFLNMLAVNPLTLRISMPQWWAKAKHVKHLELFITSFNRSKCIDMCGVKCQCYLWGLWLVSVGFEVNLLSMLHLKLIFIYLCVNVSVYLCVCVFSVIIFFMSILRCVFLLRLPFCNQLRLKVYWGCDWS